MYDYQRDNLNVAIAAGLAEDLHEAMGQNIQVFAPAKEASLTHAMVVAKVDGTTLYTITVDFDGVAVVKMIGENMIEAAKRFGHTAPEYNAMKFETNSPTFAKDLVKHIVDIWNSSHELKV